MISIVFSSGAFPSQSVVNFDYLGGLHEHSVIVLLLGSESG